LDRIAPGDEQRRSKGSGAGVQMHVPFLLLWGFVLKLDYKEERRVR